MSYYANGDTGYLWLTHNDCAEVLYLIEAGTHYWELEEAVKAHEASNCKRVPTPAGEKD